MITFLPSEAKSKIVFFFCFFIFVKSRNNFFCKVITIHIMIDKVYKLMEQIFWMNLFETFDRCRYFTFYQNNIHVLQKKDFCNIIFQMKRFTFTFINIIFNKRNCFLSNFGLFRNVCCNLS